MLNFLEFQKKIINNQVNNVIVKKNLDEFTTADEMLKFTEEVVFNEINKYSLKSKEEVLIHKVLLLLFIQGVKSFKSCLLLCFTGYYTNSIINMRNILESIFNIMYILETPEDTFNRANDYLCNMSKWTKETIKSRAYLSSNSTLYSLYSLSSDHTHANYLSTSKNCDKDGNLLSYPCENDIDKSLTIINAVYFYLLEFLCKYYKINFMPMKNLSKTKELKRQLKTFKLFNFSKRYYD